MAVADRWHRDPQPGDEPCRCGRGRTKLYPSADHLKGRRWLVRWRDPLTGKHRGRSFSLKDGGDANVHADAFDRLLQGQLVTRTYTDPDAGAVSLRKYAEGWRLTRSHSAETAERLARRLANHVYESSPGSGVTPKGSKAIGQYPVSLLAQRPTLVAAWVASLASALPAERSRRMVVDDVAAVFAAAVADGIIARNPVRAAVVDRPGRGGRKAQPFTAPEVAAIAERLPPRLRLVPVLGAGTGMRAMEMAALGVHDVQFLGRRPLVRVERQLKRVDGAFVFAPVKNRKPHEVPLAPSVAGALRSHVEAFGALEVTLPWHEPGSRRHGQPLTVRLLLRADDGGPLSRAALEGAWRVAAAKAAGATGRDGHGHVRATGQNMHRLRHTYASAQLRAGVDVVRTAAALGDTADVVVRTYAHLMRDDDGDADLRGAVDDFFSQPEAGESAEAR